GWYDTRLRDAVAALEKNPASKNLQNKVIDLSHEFDSVSVAIPILERRLLAQSEWSTDDIQQLLKYYGWEGAPDRAFSFLEKLWSKYADQSILTLKKMMVARYGTPGPDFQKRW